MVLLPKKGKNGNTVKASDIVVRDDVKIEYGEKKYTSKQRRPVQVDPPVLKAISNLSYAKDMPMYEVVEQAVKAYINNLSENEKRIFDIRDKK